MLVSSQYAQFGTDVLDSIREQDVAEVNALLGRHAAGRYRRLQVQLAWLRTDPKIGGQVDAALASCPYNSSSSATDALREENAQLKAEIEELRKKKK